MVNWKNKVFWEKALFLINNYILISFMLYHVINKLLFNHFQLFLNKSFISSLGYLYVKSGWSSEPSFISVYVPVVLHKLYR